MYNIKNPNLTVGTIMDNNFTILPTTIENSYERIEVNGIYLIDNAEYIYLYVLKEANSSLIEEVLSFLYFITMF